MRSPRGPRWRSAAKAPADSEYTDREELGVQVLVRDNNVDQALKALKKKMQREGIFREMKLRGHYEKPSEKKAREKAEARRPAADEAEAGVRRRSRRRSRWCWRPWRSRRRAARPALISSSLLSANLLPMTRAFVPALLFWP